MLSLGRPGLDILHQFHHVIFLGDMNYRVEREFEKVCESVKKGKWNDIVQYDQLVFQMERKQVFYGFKEGAIDFSPTYRWERHENVISNKRDQAPSYCDRILYTSLDETFDLKQFAYKSSPNAFGSDHRPVWSVFTFVPRMPYFTNATHFQIIGEENATEMHNNLIIENARIDLVDLKASFAGVPGLTIEDELHATFHHYYIEKPVCVVSIIIIKVTNNSIMLLQKIKINQERIVGGVFEQHFNAFSWPGIELETQCILHPYISDPEYLSHTHVFVEFVNASKSSQVVGYATISLHNAFPVKLLARVDEMKENLSEKKVQQQEKPSDDTPSHKTEENDNEPDDHTSEQTEKRKEKIIQKRIQEQQLIDKSKQKVNNDPAVVQQKKVVDMSRVKRDANAPKNFEVPILLYGKLVGGVRFIDIYNCF
ncbi:hypothetical protein RFI_23450 [Reticulomyxa filosa]|uniref:Inositol polyphosphate-related phosphatase domain-containing protein n=1 Tax=Reticulomyxa filosa TaxID=46433 RepID=X6MKF9_RETFI|nr:hypothetical protein RFI_23450 [Reticulomyxa filosa]|eukprot:ETO13917.1 hypothetical protein RFI_23450 [Reticulomyxa filosa]